MARNGSGTYSNPYPDFVSGTVISSTEVDANNSDIATALTQSIAVDGQSVVTGDIPLATHKFTAMKVGTASTDSLSLGQAQAEAFVWCATAGGSADAVTLSPTPAITAYAAGQRFVWMASGSTNTGATTVAISGLSAIALQDNGAALTAGQHAAGKMFMGVLDTTSTVQIMQVQVSGTDPLIVSSLTVTGDATIGDDLTLLSDASILGFGEHTDVLLTHVADSGLNMSVTGNNVATLGVTQDKEDSSTGPVFNLTRYSASPADADGGGIIQFLMENSADELWTAAQIYSVATDVTDTEEDGKLLINTMKAGTSTTALTISDTGIQVPDGGNVGSVTSPTALDILGTGEIGIGIAGNASHQTYIYDNTTGRNGLRVQLDNASSTQTGIYATTDGAGIAVYGSCAGAHWGVYGLSAAHYGVYGKTQSASHGGCFGISADAANYGILGHANNYGVYGTTVHSVGALTKGSGTFLIPHPLKSEIEGEPWSLAHSFIEGPQCDLIYRGRVDLVDGVASLSIDNKYGMTPGTFVWLTKSDSVQTFTSNETGWDAVRSSFSGDTITIECQNSSSTDTISWMVIAERGDPNIIASTITDDEGNLLIERPSEPEPPPPPPPEV